ncbi:hypothetical protein CFIMG_003991RA [Ceratocystis fimbriata CBS 114723]|uniref:RED-like N-terminal domain-containing protein n=1 Tax=Ceratocystis fimbriata CBS 114723 TaxID=1035309 RepID=A0A2C5WXG6_9PEZI|nr:hypothetical protein CFIMG_003991RA [Ceratocystis fimbriata CBS 114723]
MNNDQFRNLVVASTQKAAAEAADSRSSSPPIQQSSSTHRLAPKSKGTFARKNDTRYNPKASEQMRQAQHQKLFKSAAPKGVKLATGYTDRTQNRHDDDERVVEIQELERQLKEKEIDQATFERRRDEITSGDVHATHLVKGLDFKLLKRVRQGEDVFGSSGTKPTANIAGQDEALGSQEADSIDDALDDVLGNEVKAVAREKTAKKGQLSTVTTAPGQKRTRNQILADLKAARAAAKTQQAEGNAVGLRFKKIGAKQTPGSRIEIDRNGNEVLIIIDEDGHEKRKVRKAPVPAANTTSATTEGQNNEDILGHMMPDPNAAPLGMEVPEAYQSRKEQEDEDDDVNIFDDAGSDYDPLAGLDSGSDSDSGEEKDAKSEAKSLPSNDSEKDQVSLSTTTGPKNYFKDSKGVLASEQSLQGPSWSDPALQAVLKKAATLKPLATDNSDDENEDSHDPEAAARKEKRRKMLQQDDRDAQDMDMGFGTSRFEDEEEADESAKIRLSRWTDDLAGGDGDGDGDDVAGQGREGKTQRKRGGKKRKGDGNSAADVMRIVEQRRAAGQL